MRLPNCVTCQSTLFNAACSADGITQRMVIVRVIDFMILLFLNPFLYVRPAYRATSKPVKIGISTFIAEPVQFEFQSGASAMTSL